MSSFGRLKKNIASRKADKKTDPGQERLVSVALRRNGVVESRGFKEHWKLRAALGDEDPYSKNPSDEEGFLTSSGRFVDRYSAIQVGLKSGQLSRMWERSERSLLSADVDW